MQQLKNLSKLSKKAKINLLMLLVVVITLPLALYAVRLYQNYKGHAAGGNAALTFSPVSQSSAVGVAGTYNVFLSPNSELVNAVELYISYDPAIVNVTDITPGPFFNSSAGSPVIITKSIANGIIHYAVGFPLGSNVSSTTANTVAIINYTGLTGGTSAFTFLTTSPTATLVSNTSAANVLGTTTNGSLVISGPTPTPSPTPTKSPSPSPSPTRSPSPTPSPTPVPGWTKVDERDPSVVYSAGWQMQNESGAYLTTQEYTNTTSASATFSFSGSGVRVWSKYNTNHGYANIYVDNVLKTSVNTNGTQQWQVLVYELTGLTNGPHTLKFENAGNPAGSYIVTDAFEYYTGTITPSPSPTPTRSPSPTPTSSPSPTPTPSRSPSPTPTRSPSPTPTANVTASPSTAPKLGDVNGDGVVNIVDIGIVIDNYNKQPIIVPSADINKDGSVDIIDIGIIIDHYGM